MKMNINLEVARKVLTTVDAGLCKGMGQPEPGKMCVEAAVNYALGAEHGDEPACVAPALRHLKIRLNDSAWSSNQTRAKGLRRLALIQLGSADHLDEKELARRCARLAIQTCVPQALRAAARLFEGDKKDKLLNAADLCEREPTIENAHAAKSAASAYSAASAVYSADSAASAVYSADSAVYSADSAVYSAVYSAAYSADSAASAVYSAAARDTLLAAFAEGVVQILIDMKVPGVQWLHLTEDPPFSPYFARTE